MTHQVLADSWNHAAVRVIAAMAAAIAIACGGAAPAAAQDTQPTTATGFAAVVNNDVGKARDDAIENALRTAVEQAVGTLVDSATLVENFQTVEDRIYTQSHGYVSNYHIIKESQPPNAYQVTITATVRLSNLEQDLQALGLVIGRKGNPRTMLMIAEQNLAQPGAWKNWWAGGATDLSVVETELMKLLGDKGFPMVDHNIAAGEFKVAPPHGRAQDPNDSYVRQVGKGYNAEVVIVGKAQVQTRPYRSGHTAQATVTARAVDVDTGSVIASTTESSSSWHMEPTMGGTKALQKAAKKTADALAKRIAMVWATQVQSGGEILLVVNNVKSANALRDLKATLPQIRGLKAINQRSFVNGRVELAVTYKGLAPRLAEEVEGLTYPGFTVDLIEQTQNQLVFNMR